MSVSAATTTSATTRVARRLMPDEVRRVAPLPSTATDDGETLPPVPTVATSALLTVGLWLWQLRLALFSGWASAAAHMALVIGLAVISGPPPIHSRTPPALPLQASVTVAKSVPVSPQFLDRVKVRVETSVHSVAPKNAAAKGRGSAGSGGGQGGGAAGGTQLAGISIGPPRAKSGGTGMGTDTAFGTHMLGEVGELADPSATFFGVKADGRKFAFVVDTSGSMAQNARFMRCRAELLRSLSSMQYGQQYFVVFFNHTLYSMPEHKLVDARPNQLKKTSEWVVGAVPLGGTEPWPGLQLALRLKPDAIYLLTDGQFDPAVVNNVVNAQRESKKIPIHTIAFENIDGAKLLEAISRATGGQHQFVP